MARARREHDWALTSTVLCMLAEVNRDKKKRARAFHPDEFNPCVLERRKELPLPKIKVTDLKGLFVGP
jgi:hypothetical protein